MFGSWYIYIGAITTSQKNACMSTNCETKNQQTLWVLATRLASASLVAWITVFDQGSHYQTRRESTCRIRKLAVVKAPFFPILSIFGHGSWQNSSPVATNVKRFIAKLGWCYPHIGWYHAPFPEVTTRPKVSIVTIPHDFCCLYQNILMGKTNFSSNIPSIS